MFEVEFLRGSLRHGGVQVYGLGEVDVRIGIHPMRNVFRNCRKGTGRRAALRRLSTSGYSTTLGRISSLLAPCRERLQHSMKSFLGAIHVHNYGKKVGFLVPLYQEVFNP